MQRDKGRKAEAEVRELYAGLGFEVRGLEAGGDHLAVARGLMIHSEVKRCETLRLPAWSRQTYREAPAGSLPVLAFRRSREPWQAATPEGEAHPYLAAAGYTGGIHYSLRDLGGQWWALSSFELLVSALATGAARLETQGRP